MHSRPSRIDKIRNLLNQTRLALKINIDVPRPDDEFMHVYRNVNIGWWIYGHAECRIYELSKRTSACFPSLFKINVLQRDQTFERPRRRLSARSKTARASPISRSLTPRIRLHVNNLIGPEEQWRSPRSATPIQRISRGITVFRCTPSRRSQILFQSQWSFVSANGIGD